MSVTVGHGNPLSTLAYSLFTSERIQPANISCTVGSHVLTPCKTHARTHTHTNTSSRMIGTSHSIPRSSYTPDWERPLTAGAGGGPPSIPPKHASPESRPHTSAEFEYVFDNVGYESAGHPPKDLWWNNPRYEDVFFNLCVCVRRCQFRCLFACVSGLIIVSWKVLVDD
jgi:hypothetical protein